MGLIGTRISVFASLLFGCGSVKDSGAIDAAIDANTIDADESGNATIVTEAALFGGTVGANVGDVDIVSMLPNNTVLEMKKTDAGGNATIKVFPGGSVTAIYKHTIDMGADLITWVGVKPGDTLTFGSRNFSTAGQTNALFGGGPQPYTWVAQAGVTGYIVSTSCNAGGFGAATSGSMSEFTLCHRDPMDVLFVGTDATGITHFNVRANQTFSTTTAINNGGWAVAPTASVNMTGLPTEVRDASAQWFTVLDGATEQSFANGVNQTTPTGGAVSGTFKFHATGDRTIGRVLLNRTAFQQMQVVDQFSTSTTTQTVASPVLTPWLQGNVAASSGVRMASWFMVPGVNSVHDGVVLRLSWNHVVSSMPNQHQWHIIMPPNTQAIALPKLPAQFNDNLPAPQDSMSAQVKLFDISTVNGYDALRAQPSRNVMCTDCALRGGDYTRVISTGSVQ